MAALIYIAVVAVMSAIAFVLYALDKRRARENQWRISEATLHTIELLGGWPGGIAGRAILRHKSSKLSFRAVSWLIIAGHLGLIAWWVAERSR